MNVVALLIAPNEDSFLNLSPTEVCSAVQSLEEAVHRLRGLPHCTLNDVDKTAIKDIISILQRMLSS